MKKSRIFAICCFFTLMTLGILFADKLKVYAPTVSCGESAYYVQNSYLGYYEASDVVHIYQKVWGGNDRYIVTLPAKYEVYTTTSRDSEGDKQRTIGVIAKGELKNSAGNLFASLSQVDYVEDLGSWVPGWPWFGSPPMETTTVTADEDWQTDQPENCVVEGSGSSHYVTGGTSLTAGAGGFSVGSGSSTYTTTGVGASNSGSFSVMERNHIVHSSSSTPPTGSGSGGSTPPTGSTPPPPAPTDDTPNCQDCTSHCSSPCSCTNSGTCNGTVVDNTPNCSGCTSHCSSPCSCSNSGTCNGTMAAPPPPPPPPPANPNQPTCSAGHTYNPNSPWAFRHTEEKTCKRSGCDASLTRCQNGPDKCIRPGKPANWHWL